MGCTKKDYIENMYNWTNDDEVTYYMVTGLYPSNIDRLKEEYSNLVKGKNIIFSIIDKKRKKIIGFAGLYTINGQTRSAELRIIIGDKNIHGKGVGTISVRYVVKYAFEKLNLNKVWLGVNAKSKGALRCYEKVGFMKEGILRQEIYRNNQYYDAIRMSILRREWEKKK